MFRVTGVVRLLLAALVALFGLVGAAQARAAQPPQSVALAELPAEAQQVLQLIRQGGPFPYPHKDGSVFGNFERLLPLRSRGYYREYTVPTPGSASRGARRIVAGQGGGGETAQRVLLHRRSLPQFPAHPRIRRYSLLFIPLYAILSVDYEVGGIADEGRHGS